MKFRIGWRNSSHFIPLPFRHDHGRNFNPIVFKFLYNVESCFCLFAIENQQNRFTSFVKITDWREIQNQLCEILRSWVRSRESATSYHNVVFLFFYHFFPRFDLKLSGEGDGGGKVKAGSSTSQVNYIFIYLKLDLESRLYWNCFNKVMSFATNFRTHCHLEWRQFENDVLSMR